MAAGGQQIPRLSLRITHRKDTLENTAANARKLLDGNSDIGTMMGLPPIRACTGKSDPLSPRKRLTLARADRNLTSPSEAAAVR